MSVGKNDFDRLLAGLSAALAEPVQETSRPDPAPLARPSILDRIDVAAIRRRTGLSQPAFAARSGDPAEPGAGPPIHARSGAGVACPPGQAPHR
jgi:hypothetical protein